MPKSKRDIAALKAAAHLLGTWAADNSLVEYRTSLGPTFTLGTLKMLESDQNEQEFLFVSQSRETFSQLIMSLWEAAWVDASLPDEPTVHLKSALHGILSISKAAVRMLTDDEMAAAAEQLNQWTASASLMCFITTPLVETAFRGKIKAQSSSQFVLEEKDKERFHIFDLRECSAAKVEKIGNYTMLRLGGLIGNYGITIMDENTSPEALARYPFITKMIQ